MNNVKTWNWQICGNNKIEYSTGNINGLEKHDGPEYWKTSVLYKRKNECKNGYQPGTNLGKEENGYPPTESTVLWIGQGIVSNDVWKTELHAAELQVRDSSSVVVELAIEHLKRQRKSPGTNQTPVALMQSGGMTWTYSFYLDWERNASTMGEIYFLSVAKQPNSGSGRLIVEVSRSHQLDTHVR